MAARPVMRPTWSQRTHLPLLSRSAQKSDFGLEARIATKPVDDPIPNYPDCPSQVKPLLVFRRPITMLVVTARLRRFSALVMLFAATAACSSGNGTGFVVGTVRLCYGPGPDTNLAPVVTAAVTQGNKVVASGKFRSSTSHRTHRFSLPAGTYDLAVRPGGKSVSVTIASGETTHKNLPEANCT